MKQFQQTMKSKVNDLFLKPLDTSSIWNNCNALPSDAPIPSVTIEQGGREDSDAPAQPSILVSNNKLRNNNRQSTEGVVTWNQLLNRLRMSYDMKVAIPLFNEYLHWKKRQICIGKEVAIPLFKKVRDEYLIELTEKETTFCQFLEDHEKLSP